MAAKEVDDFFEIEDDCFLYEERNSLSEVVAEKTRTDASLFVPFTLKQTELILERYVENYEVYHHMIIGGTRQGIPAKKKFIATLTEEVNALGNARRTEKQIDQKIRDEIKMLKKYSNAVKTERSRTGGGRTILPRLSRAQLRAFDSLGQKPRVGGLTRAIEIGGKTRSPSPLERRPPLPAHSSIRSPSTIDVKSSPPRTKSSIEMPPINDVGSPVPPTRTESNRVRNPTQATLISVEYKNLLIRREGLIKKNKLLDLKIAYWRKKAELPTSEI